MSGKQHPPALSATEAPAELVGAMPLAPVQRIERPTGRFPARVSYEDPLGTFRQQALIARGADELLSIVGEFCNKAAGMRATVRADAGLMATLLTRVGQARWARLMLYLGFPMRENLRQLASGGPLSAEDWGAIVANATAEDCVAAIQDPVALQVLRERVDGDPIARMPPLA